jgi:hypothetical protein
MPLAILFDLFFSAEGVEPEKLSNKELYQKTAEYYDILQPDNPTPPEGWEYPEYTLTNVEDAIFAKYYVHQKLYNTSEYQKSIQEGIKNYDYSPLLPVIATWLDHTSDKEDEYNHAKRLERCDYFAQKPAIFALNCYTHIQTQLNNLPALYPHYFKNSEAGQTSGKNPQATFYEANALELQIQYIAKLNHCKIDDCYMIPLSEFMTHIGIANQIAILEQQAQIKKI